MADGGTALVEESELVALRRELQSTLPGYLDDLARLVNVDCGSYTKPGVDRVGRWTAAFLEDLGADVSTVAQAALGDVVVAHFAGGDRDRVASARSRPAQLLCIGHLDTVFEEGTVAQRPYRVANGRALGPGVSDMKAGLLLGLYALRAVRALGRRGELRGADPLEGLTFVANPDEEIGSPVSSPVIRDLAATTDVAFVLEGARANGDIVSRRKGLVDLRISVVGRAAHAGVEPDKGRSAVLEAAHKAIALHALSGRWDGVTCNVGVLHGGTRPNIVPDAAELHVDLRSPTRAALEAAEAAVREICATSTIPDTSASIEERARHWPMEKLPGTARLVAHAQAIAGRLGFEVEDAATGGASDANTTAGLGVPTLDGLGPIGGLDHAPGEYVEIDSIVPRATLFAALLLSAARDAELRRAG